MSILTSTRRCAPYWLSVAAIAGGSRAFAQSAVRANYVALNIGTAMQQNISDLRSSWGLSGSLGVGRQLYERFAAQLDLGRLSFARPDNESPPVNPLNPPIIGPNTVQTSVLATTLGLRGIVSPGARESGGIFSLGAGVRRATTSMQRGMMHVYAEAGIGVAIPEGGRQAWIFEIRYQRAASGDFIPRWTMPMTIGVRF